MSFQFPCASTSRLFSLVTVAIIVLAGSTADAQQWKTDIGWTQLQSEFGAALEDGSGIIVSQVEASNGMNYSPAGSSAEFAGKTFYDGSGASDGTSTGHATTVGRYFYGSSLSIATGTSDITAFDAGDWLNIATGAAGGGDPLAQVNGLGQVFDVQNHSYISNGNGAAAATNVLQRVDFMANRDNTTIVVGTNNSGATPELLVQGYNTITVGRSNGGHATGATTFYGAGRTKPEIVAPFNATSWASPVVGSSASILRQAGAGTNATQNETVKAILLAGASKNESEFAANPWTKDTVNNLDDVYGVGELDIYNSYHILQAGEQTGSSGAPGMNSSLMGWDYESNIAADTSLFYDFDLATGADEVSIALTWNILVDDLDPSAAVFDASTTLNDLDLRFYDSSGSFMGSLLDSSLSTIDNIEHLYLTNLAAGLYTLEVSRKSGSAVDQDFGLAWRIDPAAVPEPGSMAVLVGVGIGFCLRRRRSV